MSDVWMKWGPAVAALLCLAGEVAAVEEELELPPVQAFAIGALRPVKDVEVVDLAAFRESLAVASARGEPWTRSFVQLALHASGMPAQGREQNIAVTTGPREWEPGREFHGARVTLEDRGWLDDSVRGERWVVWIVEDGRSKGFTVARVLRARECDRSGGATWYYTAGRCP